MLDSVRCGVAAGYGPRARYPTGQEAGEIGREHRGQGLDPAQLIVVVATEDAKRRYKVIEGNRRMLALKALETPTLVQSALPAAEFKKLQVLAGKCASAPIGDRCIFN